VLHKYEIAYRKHNLFSIVCLY